VEVGMKVRVTCGSCGDVQTAVEHLVVLVGGEQPPAFRFRCPTCRSASIKNADERVTDLLISLGAPIGLRDGDMAGIHGVPESAPPDAGPPLGEHDVEQLRTLLEGRDWFDELASTVRW
jgi:hypothetical protein